MIYRMVDCLDLGLLNQRCLRCVLVPASGVLTAAAAFLVNLSVENISGAKFGLTLSVMEKSGWVI